MEYKQHYFEYIYRAKKTYHLVLEVTFVALFGMVLFLSFLQQAAADSSKIVKWKDDKGVTHYGDKIPPQYANGENSLINKQGITIKRNKPVSYHDLALEVAEAEQKKHDHALLSAFTNENEIDLARDRNLQLDQVTLEGLHLQKTNSNKHLNDLQNYAASFKKKKKPLPADLAKDIASNQAVIAKINLQIVDRKAIIDATRKRFNDDKKRYIALKNHANGTGPKPEPPLINVP